MNTVKLIKNAVSLMLGCKAAQRGQMIMKMVLQRAVAATTDGVELAQKGTANAQHILCYSYHQGLGVAKDYKEEVKW